MKDRTQLLQNIRPIIDLELNNATAYETFQCKTLRPILKFQNESLLFLLKQHLTGNKIKIGELTNEKKEVLIHSILKKELKLKALLTGLIVGHFTLEELSFYSTNRIETNKRIIELLIKRISDQKEQL